MSASATETRSPPASDLATVRRANARILFQEYLERQIAAGVPPKGLEALFARSLEISPSMWSQIKTGRPIGNKLSRQIEEHAGREPGWLDVERHSDAATPGEQQLLALCLKAMRATNAVGRKQLKQLFLAIADGRARPEDIGRGRAK